MFKFLDMEVVDALKLMEGYISRFPQDLMEGISIGESSDIAIPKGSIDAVLLVGLGGSGIGGKIVKAFYRQELKVPMQICQTYTLPEWVNSRTLVIGVSYSGNTEETLFAIRNALEKKAQIACVTSGGTLSSIATQHKLSHIIIPGGQPPRTSFGFNCTQLFFILQKAGLIENTFISELKAASAYLSDNSEEIKNRAFKIARKIGDLIPIIYADSRFEGLALRLKQQVNENAKRPSWHGLIPEMNHNELVGWAGAMKRYAGILLIPNQTDERILERFNLTQKILEDLGHPVIRLSADGLSGLMEIYYLLHLSDWISYFMAELKGVDPIEIRVIDTLKKELSKL